MYTNDMNAELQKRVLALEVKLYTVEWQARHAWEAEMERLRASRRFWWNACRAIALLTIALTWGLYFVDRK